MRIRNIETNELSVSTFLDDVEFGIIPALPPGRYQVEFEDGRVMQTCEFIGGREAWRDFVFTLPEYNENA